MKRKYDSAIGIILLLLGTISALIWPVFGPEKAISGRRLPPMVPVGDIQVPDSMLLARIDRLDRELVNLARGENRRRHSVDLSALGYVPMSGINLAASVKEASPQVVGKLTMAFCSPLKRFCVIDGNLYTEGSRLPTGQKIAKIEPRRVLLVLGKYRQWIDVVSPDREVVKDES